MHILCKSRLSFSSNFRAGRVLRCWDLLLSRSHTSISKLKTCFLLLAAPTPGKNASQPKCKYTANRSSTPISQTRDWPHPSCCLCVRMYVPSSFVFVFLKLKKIKRHNLEMSIKKIFTFRRFLLAFSLWKKC